MVEKHNLAFWMDSAKLKFNLTINKINFNNTYNFSRSYPIVSNKVKIKLI